MKKKLSISKTINLLVNYIEMVVSVVLILAVLVMLVECIMDLAVMAIDGTDFNFDYFLSKLLNLIIGLEFTRMLCKHTAGTILEVVLFATARQMIVNHASTVDSLIGVISICGLFIIRKYLLPDTGQAKLSWVNLKNKIKNKSEDKPEKELSGMSTND